MADHEEGFYIRQNTAYERDRGRDDQDEERHDDARPRTDIWWGSIDSSIESVETLRRDDGSHRVQVSRDFQWPRPELSVRSIEWKKL